MLMGFRSALAVALGMAALPVPAAAREVTVSVSGRTMPWSAGANRDMAFGRQDGDRPVVIFGNKLFEGSDIGFAARGGTTTATGGPPFGPDGQADFVTNDAAGNSGSWFPSRFADPQGYPARLNQLMGAFVDGDGRIVGRPFMIGAAAKVAVPAGAMAIALGINDDIFSDNGGRLEVTVTLPDASVTVGGEGGGE